MESNSKKSRNARVLSFLGRVAPAFLAAAVLAACGGGGGGGGGRSSAPEPCDSQTSRGEDFALGSCAATTTNVFQPVTSNVVVNGTDSYTLTLDFPADLDALDTTAGFTAANKPPSDLRNIIGKLRGQAYENPVQPGDLTPPYVAITDFFETSDFETTTALPSMQYASFGTWEKFAGSGINGFNEGYLGTWFAKRPGSVVNTPPGTAATYEGRVVGVIGDDGERERVLNGRFGFSGPITIQVAAGAITSATLGTLTISFQQAGATLEVADLALNAVTFGASSAPPALTGTVSSAAGSEASSTGTYEAQYFGAGQPGAEIAGRLRFRTSNGLIAVGSFGAIRQ
ncbi:MAG TPA: hypothetical protein VGE10_09090 [Zeimonas sp.]